MLNDVWYQYLSYLIMGNVSFQKLIEIRLVRGADNCVGLKRESNRSVTQMPVILHCFHFSTPWMKMGQGPLILIIQYKVTTKFLTPLVTFLFARLNYSKKNFICILNSVPICPLSRIEIRNLVFIIPYNKVSKSGTTSPRNWQPELRVLLLWVKLHQ